MTYDANLLIKVDSTQAGTAAGALDKIVTSGAAAEKKTKELASATDVLNKIYTDVAKAAALWKIADYIKDATLLNARYETLGVSMRVVGANAGYTAKEMEAAAVGLQKTGISMVESRQQTLRLVQAQIDLSQSSKLARIAQDAAVIGNINSSEAFARLVHGIQSGQTETLRTIGINVSMERSYQQIAQELGKTTDELTQAEKTQGVLNSVMDAGSRIAGTYEAAMGTAGKQLNSATRYTEDFKLMVGETFNEALTISVMAFTTGIKGANAEVQDLAVNGDLKEWGASVTDTLAFVADAGASVAGTFQTVGDTIGMIAAKAMLDAPNFGASAEEIDKYHAAIEAINEQYRTDISSNVEMSSMFRDAVEERRKALESDTVAQATNTAAIVVNDEAKESLTKTQEKNIDKINDTIVKLAAEQAQLGMTKREQALFTASLDAMSKDATPEAIKQILLLTGQNYDLARSFEYAAERNKAMADEINDTAKSVVEAQEAVSKKIAEQQKDAADKSAKEWARFRDSASDSFADLAMQGGSVADAIAKSFERMAYKIMADLALSGLLDFISGGKTGGFSLNGSLSGAGMSGQIVSAGIQKFAPALASSLGLGGSAAVGTAVAGGAATVATVGGGTALTAAGYSSLMGGAAATGTAAAGVGATAAGVGSSIAAGASTALAAIPVAGWVALAAIAAYKVFGKESTPSFNAGLLLQDVPGAKANQKFDVDTFASGLDPVGFMRDQSKEAATAVIDTFRELDKTIVDIADKAGLKVTATAQTFSGLDERGLGSGVFLGNAGEKGKPGLSLEQQLDQYTKQLIATLAGQLDGEVLNKVLSSGNAEQMVAALNEELNMVEEAAAAAATETEVLAESFTGLTKATMEQQAAMDEAVSAMLSSIGSMNTDPNKNSPSAGPLAGRGSISSGPLATPEWFGQSDIYAVNRPNTAFSRDVNTDVNAADFDWTAYYTKLMADEEKAYQTALYDRSLEIEKYFGIPAGEKQMDGSHANGLNYVPFDGYKATLHKGERVQTASENNDISKEMREMRMQLNAALVAIAKNTGETARINRRWEGGGLPAPREA